MSSPTLSAFDIFLITLGIAPVKILIAWWFSRRRKRREEIMQKKIKELQERYKDKL